MGLIAEGPIFSSFDLRIRCRFPRFGGRDLTPAPGVLPWAHAGDRGQCGELPRRKMGRISLEEFNPNVIRSVLI